MYNGLSRGGMATTEGSDGDQDMVIKAKLNRVHKKGFADAWLSPKISGYVQTQPAPELVWNKIPGARRVMALDCEMCQTEVGYEVTRVAVTDFDGHIVYHSLVVPDNPIIDYVTEYSGITPEMLRNVRTRLVDVQRDLCQFIYTQTILVGHSLESDLRALRLIHPNVIDTSLLYPHPMGLPTKFSLKHLVRTHLGVNIHGFCLCLFSRSNKMGLPSPSERPPKPTLSFVQTEGGANGDVFSGGNPNPNAGASSTAKPTGGEKEIGHSPYEDARAAMELVKLKLKHGKDFGACAPIQSIFTKKREFTHKAAAIGPADWLAKWTGQNIHLSRNAVANDMEAEQWAVAHMGARTSYFFWTQLTALETHLQETAAAGADGAEETSKLTRVIQELDQRICSIIDSAPEHSVFIITGGQGVVVDRETDFERIKRLRRALLWVFAKEQGGFVGDLNYKPNPLESHTDPTLVDDDHLNANAEDEMLDDFNAHGAQQQTEDVMEDVWSSADDAGDVSDVTLEEEGEELEEEEDDEDDHVVGGEQGLEEEREEEIDVGYVEEHQGGEGLGYGEGEEGEECEEGDEEDMEEGEEFEGEDGLDGEENQGLDVEDNGGEPDIVVVEQQQSDA